MSAATTVTTEIRQARPDDREAIWAFLSKAYGDLAEYKLPDRWKWLFEDNPFIDDRGLPIWLAVQGIRIVGQMCAMPVELLIAGVPHDAAWAIDLVVLPECRGQGVGNRLHEAAVAHCGILMKLTMAPATRRMAERAGALTLDPLPMYFRPARMTGKAVANYVLKRTERRPQLRRVAEIGTRYARMDLLASGIINTWTRLRNALRKSSPIASDIREVDTFDRDFEGIEQRTRGDFGVRVTRSPRFLAWRFRPLGRLRYHTFVAYRDGQALGSIVLRRPDPVELQAGVIVDLVCPTGESQVRDDLLRFSVDYFGGDVTGIVCSLPEKTHGESLKKAGFSAVGQQRPTCVCTDADTRSKLGEQQDNWFLSRADHDWDQILPA